LSVVIILSLAGVPLVVAAQANTVGQPTANTVGQPVSSNGFAQVQNPLAVKSFCGLVKALLAAAIQVGIPIAVLFIVYAGFKFVLARGNAEALKEARTNFMWTIVGIGIFLGAWLLAQVVVNTVNALQAGSGNPSSLTSCQ